jgi:ligand-binding sensor domain-containing protein/serine phosphatase RsbU (regulator of sigma subunit)
MTSPTTRSTLRILAVLAATVLGASTVLQAQDGLVFTHYGVRDGLSQGSANCILQDSRGFVWIGTQDGLNRFDGYTCKVYKHDPADPTTINDNWVLTIAEDSAGVLWVRTMNGATLNRFDRVSETFSQVPRDSVRHAMARRNTVKAEHDDPDGTRWRGSLGGGLTRTDGRTGAVTTYKHDPKNPASLSDDRVYSVYRDHGGTLWVGTREGLEEFQPATGTFLHHRHVDGDASTLSDNWVWPILEDRAGDLWVGTFRGGLNRYDRVTRTFTRFRHDENDPRSLAGEQIYTLFQDRAGVIWVGMNDHGVDRFNPEFGAFRRLAHDPADPGSLSDNTIISITVGKSGIPWIGTREGLDRFDPASRRFTHFRNLPGNARSIGDNQVQALLEDSRGDIWVGMVSSGLDRYDRKTGSFTHFRHDPADPRSLSDNRVYALAEDADGKIWIGTYGGGLNLLDPVRRTFTHFMHTDSIPGSLGAPGVFALLTGRDGTLWVGTFGGGLDRLDRASGTFTHFKHDASDPASLSDDLVACLHEDRNGTLWVGTAGGLNRFDAATSKFTVYREKQGLPNDVVFGILEDVSGHLWLSTNKGIARLDPATGAVRNYDYNDGLQGDEFNQNAFGRDPVTGEMYFGGGNGITVFHPDSVKQNPYVPQVAFSAFTRYNTDDQEGKPILETGIDAKPTVTLSYKDNVAEFTFAALSFHNSAKNRYAYRLEGYNDNWIQLGTGRKATFTNLDGGSYVLQVRGSNNDGIWNDAGSALTLIVTPPWWKTTWAYVLYGMVFLSVLYGLRSFELNRREQKALVRESELRAKAAEAEKRALEAENERKTRELEDARRLQLSMLPQEVPQLPGYEIAVFMRTATEVGGDYYDFVRGDGDALNIGFGDATGHGMQAGTIVTLMKGLFLSEAGHSGIQAFFQHCSATIKSIKLGRLFMAFSLVRIQGPRVAFSSAGMPPVFLYRKAVGTVEELQLRGMPLGAMKNAPYGLQELTMDSGDVLLLLTDGLPEQKNAAGEMFNYERVRSSLVSSCQAPPEAIIKTLVAEGDAWMHGVPLDDDITLLVIRRSAT